MQTPDSDAPTPKLGRLLIVDDEVELMTVLCKSLSAQNYETTGFTSGQDALDAMATQEFDLLLTDMMMPGMDGITLLRAALEIDPQLIGIVMTGQGTVQTAVEAMKMGAYDYVLKPFKASAVLPALSRYMEARRLRLENLQLRETIAIYELSQAIAFSLDLGMILNKLADGALQQCNTDEASVLLPTQEGGDFYISVARGSHREHLVGQHVPFNEGIVGWVAQHNEPLLLRGSVHNQPFAPLYPREDIGSAISMPMLVGNKLVGVLNVNAKNRQRPFNLGQVKGLSILAGTAAAALESARLHLQVREAEVKYRAIFENAVDGMFQVTPDGHFLIANSALARMLGYESPAHLIEANNVVSSQLLPGPEQAPQFNEQLKERGKVRGAELQVRCRDGHSIWISESVRAVHDPQGSALCYEGIVEEITTRKREEERQDLRHHLTEVLSQATTVREVADGVLHTIGKGMGWHFGALWTLNSQDHVPRCIATWHESPRARLDDLAETARQGGVSPGGSLLGQVWASAEPIWLADLLAPESSPLVPSPGADEMGLHGWLGIPIRVGSTVLGVLEFFSHDVRRPESDFFELAVGLGNEVGQFLERKNAEEELNSFFDLSLDMLCVAGFDGYFKRLNPAWESTFGYDREALLNRPYLDLVHPHDLEATAELMKRSTVDRILRFENRYRCKDGTYRWIQWVSTPHPDRQLIYAAAHDITQSKEIEVALRQSRDDLEQRVIERTAELASANSGLQLAKEEAERANQAKSEFLSRMSHELRTPLNAVLGFGQMLEMDDLEPQQQANVAHIIKGGRHLLTLINEVLDLARIEAGRVDLSLEPVALKDTLLEIVSLVRPLAAQRDITVQIAGNDDALDDVYVLADQQRMKQVLLNLLSNSIKYNYDGGRVMLRCEINPIGDGDLQTASDVKPSAVIGRIRVSVEDSGPGIPDEKRERLFVPFDRLGAEHTRIEGTGLGLALSRRLVETMGGSMDMTSVPGEGSTFWFELSLLKSPAKYQELGDDEAVGASVCESKRVWPSRTLLYIEDNLSNFQLIEQILKLRPGIELLTAMQGSVGLELAREHRPDLVLLDMHLPDISGHDVLLRLQADPKTRDVPVVILSADATSGQIERLRLAGATDYMTKPIDIKRFLAMLEETLYRPAADRSPGVVVNQEA